MIDANNPAPHPAGAGGVVPEDLAGPGVIGLVNSVSQAHDDATCFQNVIHIVFNLVNVSDFQEHLHNPCIGTPMQRAGQRANTGTDSSVHMRPGRGHFSGRKC